MKRITTKLIVISFIVIVVSSLIPNILNELFGDGHPRYGGTIDPLLILIIGIVTVFITVTLYTLLVNKMLVKRIKHLNNSTKKVVVGDYDLHIVDHQKDELAELANSFNDMVEALKNNQYVNKSFVKNFSHELKTPLATIKGYAELIELDDNLSKDTSAYLEIIKNETNRLSSLSENMLLISQMDHQVIIHKNNTFNLTEQVREVIQSKQLQFEQRNLTFDLDVEEVQITSDRSLLNHVFMNLIDNAIKYAIEQSKIDIDIKGDDDSVRFLISNHMDSVIEDEKQLFKMFYTASSNPSKSSGIGLALVKRIVEKLGGHIELYIEKNQFSIGVSLPK